jgi:Basic region leucine zipper
MSPAITVPIMMHPITSPPLEAVQCPREGESLHHRRGFGVPILTPTTPADDISISVVKDPSLQRPVPTLDGGKFDRHSNSSGLLFKDNNPHSTTSKFDSNESPTLLTNPTLVSNTTVSSSPLFETTHRKSSMMDSSVSELNIVNASSASLNAVSGTFSHSQLGPNSSDSDLAMKTLFEEYVVGDFDEEPSFLFTPYTTDTSFTHSTLTSGLDTPTVNLAQIDSFLNSTSYGVQDFNLFNEHNAVNTDEWNQNPLFNPGSLAEDPIAPYAFFKNTSATVTSASPQQFSFSSIGDDHKPELPSPELSPSTTRKTPRRSTVTKPVRRVSTTPFTPITPAPTTPSTPQPVVTRATKRRLPVIDEDPAIVEKRRRNTVAAQRSRARKAEEKAEDKVRISQLEKENENLRTILSYWKDRACELGASPMEDGEN